MFAVVSVYTGRGAMTPPDFPEGSGWGAAIASALATLVWLRTKLSRQKVEVTEDSAKVSLIEVLQKERDQARQGEAEARSREDKAWKLRAQDAKLIGELTIQVQHFSQVNALLEEQVGMLRTELQDIRREMHELRGG